MSEQYIETPRRPGTITTYPVVTSMDQLSRRMSHQTVRRDRRIAGLIMPYALPEVDMGTLLPVNGVFRKEEDTVRFHPLEDDVPTVLVTEESLLSGAFRLRSGSNLQPEVADFSDPLLLPPAYDLLDSNPNRNTTTLP